MERKKFAHTHRRVDNRHPEVSHTFTDEHTPDERFKTVFQWETRIIAKVVKAFKSLHKSA